MLERNITGKNIKKYRISKEISQEQLAAKLNILGIDIDQTILSRIENQAREVLDFEIKGIAISLGVKINDLFD